MAKTDRNVGWPGFFRAFTVLCAIVLLLAQSGQNGVAVGSGTWQVLSVYEGLTSWTIPALFMLWGMYALEGGGGKLTGALTGMVLPALELKAQEKWSGRCGRAPEKSFFQPKKQGASVERP